MLPHTLLYTLFIATSSAAFIPPPRIPNPPKPQIIEPIAPAPAAPNPYRPADRPDSEATPGFDAPEMTGGFQAPKPTGGFEVPDVPLPDDDTASKVASRPYGNPAKTLSPAQVAASLAASKSTMTQPTATPTTGMTVPASTGGAARIEDVGMGMSLVGLVVVPLAAVIL
ncbi:hypothetical protein J4E86_002697 [Alternaria arbusti]|uniref:uncharacterized protein n=1 Tax=Alternaria arbusti TaxID=232088 RepID=UPI00221E7ACF|nr:uncharacterized protein J4E86_002697 [Alternaria arbusti]KAI4958977.1 hypothetical protein J4E86_002697 [Alternaria arbusti]